MRRINHGVGSALRLCVGASLLGGLGAGCVAGGSEDDLVDDDEVADLADTIDFESSGSFVSIREVCFTVNNPGEAANYTVHGTLFAPSSFGKNTTALVLYHGAASDRLVWDGGKPTVRNTISMARAIALGGYGVFSIDRLGYGESTYPGPGFNLTAEGYVQMTRQIVQQVHDGTYRTTTNNCATGTKAKNGNARVVLGGQSAGAAIVEAYATRYDDIDGLLSVTWSNSGLSNYFNNFFGTYIIPQIYTGATFAYFFPPEDDGFSELCAEFLLWGPGMDPTATADVCGPYYLKPQTSPFGEDPNSLSGEILANLANIEVPVLKLLGDHDVLIPSADYRGISGTEADLATPEIQAWEDGTSGPFRARFAKDSGHNPFFQKSSGRSAAEIVYWLRQNDL